MKLQEIKEITGKIRVVTGLHIGAGNDDIQIGGIDNPVIKNPLTNEPYIPGSSLKGKIRTLLEWWFGTSDDGGPTKVQQTIEKDDNKKEEQWKFIFDNKGNPVQDKKAMEKLNVYKTIAKIFGNGGTIKNETIAKEIGPTRISFFDASLTPESSQKLRELNALTESKMEVRINRFTGSVDQRGGGPRQTERVPAGAEFAFKLTYLVFDEEDKKNFKYVLMGMKLLEKVGLGGSVSRGYGKVEFCELEGVDDEDFVIGGKLRELDEIKSRLDSDDGNDQNNTQA